jgi:hypothetical protein
LPVAKGPFPWSASRVRLMNSSVEEFRRALVHAFGAAVSETDSGFLLSNDGVQLHFALTRESERRIGALQLTMLRVEISVQSGDESAAEKLLARVDRATQRGGG